MSYNIPMVGVDTVPIPAAKGGRPPKYPYKELVLGQSFFAAGVSHINTKSWSNVTGYRFTIRRVTENDIAGVRVFRIG
jgi:hypothetical protein